MGLLRVRVLGLIKFFLLLGVWLGLLQCAGSLELSVVIQMQLSQLYRPLLPVPRAAVVRVFRATGRKSIKRFCAICRGMYQKPNHPEGPVDLLCTSRFLVESWEWFKFTCWQSAT